MGVRVDLTGQRFGKLLVLKYVGSNKHRHSMYECVCDCGNIVVVIGGSLTSGRTVSCGCYNRLRTHETSFKDIVGQKFGHLLVLSLNKIDSDNVAFWNCVCDCGNTTVTRGCSLRNGTTTSCGCYKRQRTRETHFKDLTGLRFGRLVVLKEFGHNKHKHIEYECICDCGNIVIVDGGSLTQGNTASCGCYMRELLSKRRFKDLTGQRFGRWSVVSFSRMNSHQKAVWNCLCDCGVAKEVVGGNLVSGQSTNCGCFGREQLIKSVTTHGMSYTSEYKTMQDRKRRELEYELDTKWTLEMECELFKFQSYCTVCGMTMEEHLKKYNKRLHVDHVLPLSKGYGLYPGNAVVLCSFHNESKRNKDLDKLPVEWREKIICAASDFKNYWDEKMHV